MRRYLLDTSVFVALEHGRTLGDPPDGEARVSVATLTELAVGVHRSPPDRRRAREATLASARRFLSLAYDEAVGERLARLLAAARDNRSRFRFPDGIIAATALAHDLTVVTQDGDFDVLADLEPALRVVRV